MVTLILLALLLLCVKWLVEGIAALFDLPKNVHVNVVVKDSFNTKVVPLQSVHMQKFYARGICAQGGNLHGDFQATRAADCDRPFRF